MSRRLWGNVIDDPRAGPHGPAPQTSPFEMTGIVQGGYRQGRLLGFPTANLAIGVDCPLPDGVWAGLAVILDSDVGVEFPAAISIGTRPTYAGFTDERVLEAHLLGFCGSLYGRTLRVSLHHYIREQARFRGSEQLSNQIREDVRRVRSWDSSRRRSRAPGASR